jgi:hypothetical protein
VANSDDVAPERSFGELVLDLQRFRAYGAGGEFAHMNGGKGDSGLAVEDLKTCFETGRRNKN